MQHSSKPHVLDGVRRATAAPIKCIAANDPRELSSADHAVAANFAGPSPFSAEVLYDGSPESEARLRAIDAGMDKQRYRREDPNSALNRAARDAEHREAEVRGAI